jgi:hypothetical protein
MTADSAINPGNSGGPAFSSLEQGIVAGVAFSKNTAAENCGYLISFPVVRHFFAEFLSFGRFRGLPSPGFATQPLENEAAALALGLPAELAGVQGAAVTRVDPLGSAASATVVVAAAGEGESGGGKGAKSAAAATAGSGSATNSTTGLRVGDVVDSIDGVPVAADESIPFRGEERLDWTHLVLTGKHIGQRLKVVVWRQQEEETGAAGAGGDGGDSNNKNKRPPPPAPSGRAARRVELELTLQPQAPLVPLLHGVDAFPSYLVFGGVVFVPLSLPALEAMFGRRWRSSAPVGALAALQRPRDRGGLGSGNGGDGGDEEQRQQVVVVSHVLAHQANHGLSRVLAVTGAMVPVETVDGRPLHSMRQLCQWLDGAMAEAKAEAAAGGAGAGGDGGDGGNGGASTAPQQQRRYVTFGLHGGPFISMDCVEVAKAQDEILEANSIARDRSADLC